MRQNPGGMKRLGCVSNELKEDRPEGFSEKLRRFYDNLRDGFN
jgi:hypothetical protein